MSILHLLESDLVNKVESVKEVYKELKSTRSHSPEASLGQLRAMSQGQGDGLVSRRSAYHISVRTRLGSPAPMQKPKSMVMRTEADGAEALTRDRILK